MQHASFLINASVLQETARILSRTPRPSLPQAMLRTLRDRHAELHRRDLANVEAGLYPSSLLFGMPFADYARALPRLVRDAPNIVKRKRARNFQDLPASALADKTQYPAYYRRNFHWQTDGYLSEHSAEIYELGVELLFRGTADVMRRQVIPPITRFTQENNSARRLLDVACGTGGTLRQIAKALPELELTGIDLSPDYIRVAKRRLASVPNLNLVVGNAESIDAPDGAHDIVTSVYLFHELPRNTRRHVVSELWRVLSPGGLLVIEDSAQPSDSPEIVAALRNFPVEFHEPFYNDYLDDDLAQLVAERGFIVQSSEAHLVAKVVVARKPS